MSRIETAIHSVPWISALLAAAAVPLLLHETTRELIRQWDSAYNYGYLILPAALVLGWQRRHQLVKVLTRPNATGLFAAAAAGMVWIMGYLSNVAVAQQLAMIVLIVLAFWTVLGTAITRALIYPLLYLFLMVPVPIRSFLERPLMDFTAYFIVAAAKLSGVPIYRDGMVLSIPAGNFSIVEACSGIAALTAFVLTGIFLAGINFRSPQRQLIFVAISIVVAIVANGLRAYGIVMLGHFGEMRWVYDHGPLGDIWYSVVLILLFLIGRYYSDLDDDTPASNTDAHRPTTLRPAWPSVVAAGLSMVIVALIAFSGAAMEQALANRSLQAFPELPIRGESWSFSPTAPADWQPLYTGAVRETAGHYLSATASIDARIISYGYQTQGAELINSLNQLFDPEYWTALQQRAGSAALQSGREWPYRMVEIQSEAGSKRVIWYWFLIDGYPTIHPINVKLREAVNLFSVEKSVSSLVALSAPFEGDLEQNQATLGAFLNTFCRRSDQQPGSTLSGKSPCGSF